MRESRRKQRRGGDSNPRWTETPIPVFETVTVGYTTPGISRDFAIPDVAVGKLVGKSVRVRRDFARRIEPYGPHATCPGDRREELVCGETARALRLGVARPRGPP